MIKKTNNNENNDERGEEMEDWKENMFYTIVKNLRQHFCQIEENCVWENRDDENGDNFDTNCRSSEKSHGINNNK